MLLAAEQSRGAQTLLLGGDHNRNLMRTIHLLRDRFRETLRIEDLARAANMSPTTFFRQFKLLSPLGGKRFKRDLALFALS